MIFFSLIFTSFLIIHIIIHNSEINNTIYKLTRIKKSYPFSDQNPEMDRTIFIKCKLERDQVLLLFNRSSNAAKRGLIIPNGVGVVDSDYYNNLDNEGQIFGLFSCVGQKSYLIHKGDRIMQGIITDYHIVDNDITMCMRMGSFGSTGKK